MKVSTPPPIPPEVLSSLRHAVADGATQSQIIEQMRATGLHKIESIKAYRMLYGGSLTDAKVAVHCSEVWSDRRQSDEAFHDAVIEIAKDLGFKDAEARKDEASYSDTLQHTR